MSPCTSQSEEMSKQRDVSSFFVQHENQATGVSATESDTSNPSELSECLLLIPDENNSSSLTTSACSESLNSRATSSRECTPDCDNTSAKLSNKEDNLETEHFLVKPQITRIWVFKLRCC